MTEAVAAPAAAPAASPTTSAQAGGATPTAQVAAAAGATPTADPNVFTVTVDGKEVPVTLDELKRGYAHGRAANERMRAASETRQQAEEVLKIFRENPRMAMEKLGVDAKAFAEQVLNEHLEDMSLSDEQRELKKLRAQMKQFAEQEERAKAEQQAASEKAFRDQVTQQMQQDIIGALQSSGLPRNEYTVGRIAYYMEAALTAGFPNVTAQNVIPYVRTEYEKDVQSLLGSLSEDQIESFLGKDISKKVLKSSLSKVKTPPTKTAEPNQGSNAKKPANMTTSDWFRQQRKARQGKA